MDEAEKEIARLKARVAQLELENSRLSQRVQYLERSAKSVQNTNVSTVTVNSNAGRSSSVSSLSSNTGGKLGTVVLDHKDDDSGGAEQKYCNTCDRFIPLTTFSMHTVHCARNITECLHCGEKVTVRQMDAHISDSVGTVEEQIKAIVLGDVPRIEKMVQHGFAFSSALPSPTLPTESSASQSRYCAVYYREGDTPLHVACRSRQLPVIQYFAASQAPVTISGVSSTAYFNMRNASGETPLHVACCSPDPPDTQDSLTSAPFPGHPLLDVLACLIEKGAEIHARNLLGDSCSTLLQRLGRFEPLSFLSSLMAHLDTASNTNYLQNGHIGNNGSVGSGNAIGTEPLFRPPSRPPSRPSSRPSSANSVTLAPLTFLPPVRPSSAAKERLPSAGRVPPLGGVPVIPDTGIQVGGIASRRGSFLDPL